jgi:hypothetical protein
MFTHPGLTSQLAREHHRQMLAEARRRQLRPRYGRQATRNASGAGKIIRRVAAVIAGAGIAALPSSTTEHHLSRCRQQSQPPARRLRATAALSGWQTDDIRGAVHVVRGRERDAR